MNECEKVVLANMVELNEARRLIAVDNHAEREYVDKILLLLNCICDWRYPKTTAIEDGCGKLVSANEA
ncbi:MAG: hypothetical protein IJ111_01390 [Eggerthellaceae bacterium]|nr:hypothetical protein [Eggerthellaceae bacterium]